MEDYNDLEKLRYLINKNPAGYRNEVDSQIKRFDALFDTIHTRTHLLPDQKVLFSPELTELLSFLTAIANPQHSNMAKLSDQIMQLIQNKTFINQIGQEDRIAVLNSAIQLHNRKMAPTASVLEPFFLLLDQPQKELRKAAQRHVVKSLCKEKSLLFGPKGGFFAFLAAKVAEDDAIFAKKAVSVLAELYRRNASRAAKVPNAVARGVFSRHAPIARRAMWFLLGEDGRRFAKGESTGKEAASAAKRREETKSFLAKYEKGRNICRVKANKTKKIKRLKKARNSAKERKCGDDDSLGEIDEKSDFGPIRSLHDPHGYAEKVFRALKKSRESFETKLLAMKLLSRIISCHELVLVNFYSFLQRYMQPHQRSVTKILTYLVQSAHAKVPAAVIRPCIDVLALNFVTDRSSPQVIAVGLNAVRGVCARQPLVMDEALLRDFSQYKTAHEKPVAAAARGLIGFFREENPKLLARKDRGRAKETKQTLGAVQPEDSEEEEEITPEFPVTEQEILGDIKRKKDREKAKEAKKDSFCGKRKAIGATNEDKQRNKNFKMAQQSRKAQNRSKRSLLEKRRTQTTHKKRLALKSRRKFKPKKR